MGFKEGEGLGKFGQGRREIVEASTQRGRRGLGLTLQGFEGELNVEWKDEPEVYKMFPLSLLHDCTSLQSIMRSQVIIFISNVPDSAVV